MNLQGRAFGLSSVPADGWAALWRCWLPNYWHTLTTSDTCDDLPYIAREGPIGYIALSPLPGTVELREYFRQDPQLWHDSLYTVNPAEVLGPPWVQEASPGWVCP